MKFGEGRTKILERRSNIQITQQALLFSFLGFSSAFLSTSGRDLTELSFKTPLTEKRAIRRASYLYKIF